MPSKEEMTRFFWKRGVPVDVTIKPPDTYIIECMPSHENKVDAILKNILEPGRFIIHTRKTVRTWWQVWKK